MELGQSFGLSRLPLRLHSLHVLPDLLISAESWVTGQYARTPSSFPDRQGGSHSRKFIFLRRVQTIVTTVFCSQRTIKSSPSAIPVWMEWFVWAMKTSNFWAHSNVMCHIPWYKHHPSSEWWKGIIVWLLLGACMKCSWVVFPQRLPHQKNHCGFGIKQHPCWEFQWWS